jgi:hypothetical protein
MLSSFEHKFFTLAADHIKLQALSRSLENNLEKTNALSSSIAAYSHVVKEVAKQAQAGKNGKENLDILLELISYSEKSQQLTSNSLQAFEALDIELKRNKRFLLLALMSGVDGRLLTYVCPYVMFMNEPKGEQDFDEWYKAAEFDTNFFSLVTELNEHCFYGLHSNLKTEGFVANGYEKFDIWENQSAWISAFKNPKFLKYHDDFSFKLVMEERAGTPLEAEIVTLLTKVKSDISGFAAQMIQDYFPFGNREKVEKTYDVEFNEDYFIKIINTKPEEAALDGKSFAGEIYSTTNLREFERVIQFIYSV